MAALLIGYAGEAGDLSPRAAIHYPRGKASADHSSAMFAPKTRPALKPGIGKGVLDPHGRDQRFKAALYEPCSELAPFIEHYWTVDRWPR